MTPIKVDSYADIPSVIDQLSEFKRAAEENKSSQEKLFLAQLKETGERNEVLTKELEKVTDENERLLLLLERESNNHLNIGLRHHLAAEYLEALEEYEIATILNPKTPGAYSNWGVALCDLAKTKSGSEAEDLYKEAIDKYREAVKYRSDDHAAYYNWGNALSDLAETKSGSEAEDLYNEAIDKYREVVKYRSDDHAAYNNWGNALIYLAQIKSDSEAENLYDEAIEKYLQAIEYGGDSFYNLACLYVLRNRKEEALKYLDHALSRGEVSVEILESRWIWLRDDPDFKRLLSQYKGK